MKYAILLIILGHMLDSHATQLPKPAACAVEKPAGKTPAGVDYWARWPDGIQWRIANNPSGGWGIRKLDRFNQGFVWTYGAGHWRIATAKMTNCEVVRLINDFRARLNSGNRDGIITAPVNGVP